MSIRLKLTLLLILLFTTAIGNTIFTFVLEGYVEEKLGWVIQTHKVMNKSEKLLSMLKDTETGQRGFLLTGNANYLEPYYSGVSKAQKYYGELLQQSSDIPSQQKHLADIKEPMNNKFKEMKRTIELVQKGDNDGALEVVKQDSGKIYMDNIRVKLTAFNNEELLLLEKRKGDFRESRAKLTTLVIVELLFFIFLAFITLFFVKGSLFNPLKLLLLSTAKMEKGERQKVSDLLPNDEMGYLLSRFHLMSEKVLEKTEVLAYDASHDELTGLRNRVGIHDEINDSITSLKRHDAKMAVIFIDLNDFKKLNDTLGHDAGDLILKETASRLVESVRSEDAVFRQGGDEFIVVIKNINDVSHAENIVTNVIDRFKPPVMFSGHAIDISLSIGIAISPDDTINSDEIIKFSDVAMYEAKRDKNTNYKFFDVSMLKRSNDT